MCGRFVVNWLPVELLKHFQLRLPGPPFATFNAAPTQELPVVFEQESGERELAMMRWGLVPRWTKAGAKPLAPFNARAESILEKPMFRSLANRRRCLVPANGYYEWKLVAGRKRPYYFTLKDEEIFSFAGLYDEFKDDDGERKFSFTVITTEPNELTADYHQRMPVILSREGEAEWIDREIDDGHAVAHLLRPYPADQMRAHAVSTDVNNVRNNDAHLIVPIDETEAKSEEKSSKSKKQRGQQPLF